MSEKIVQLNEEIIKGQLKELVRVKISKVNSTVRMPLGHAEFSRAHRPPAACLPYRKTENFAIDYLYYSIDSAFLLKNH